MKKFAVIGLGSMGNIHAKNIINAPDIELSAIISRRGSAVLAELETTGNLGKCELPLEKLKQVPVYSTLTSCLSEQSLDAVVICTPLLSHFQLTKEALEAGLHVLLEKPFCPEIEQCQTLIKLAKQQHKQLMIAHCVRFTPAWQFLADSIRDRRYGELKLLTTSRSGGEPTWGCWQDEQVKKSCGGALLDLVIHDLDFVNSLLGYPDEVKVNMHCGEYWEIALAYQNNPAAISVKGGFLYRHSTFESVYAATFSNGSIRFSSLNPGVIHIGTDDGAEIVKVEGDAYMNELKYFVKSIADHSLPLPHNPETAMKTIELCLSIKAESGKK